MSLTQKLGKKWRFSKVSNLDMWKLSDELAYNVYLSSRDFPKEEIYGITSQLRRAALSIPTNMMKSKTVMKD